MDTLGNITDEKLMDDLWLVTNNEKSLAFAPLKGKVFLVNPNGVEALHSYFCGTPNEQIEKFFRENALFDLSPAPKTNIGKPYLPISIVLSLTSGCNLRCIYCYANAGSNPKNMSKDTVKSAVDIALEHARRKGIKEFRVLFHGGGEALTIWPLVKFATEYIVKTWDGHTRFSMVTNATLVTPERANWFKKHRFHFTISLDGPEDIQNTQRPMANGKDSYKACVNGVKLLRENGLFCGIRATITGENVHRMDEIVRIAAELDCGLKVEPVTHTGRGVTGVKCLQPYEFAEAFQSAKVLSEKLGVKLISTYSPSLKPRARYCAADGEMFLVQPEGKISSCSRVTTIEDELSNVFIIGDIKDEQLNVNQKMVDNLRNLHVNNFDQCENCFAKWHCAGGCHSTRLSLGGKMPKEHCDLVRWFMWAELLHQANN